MKLLEVNWFTPNNLNHSDTEYKNNLCYYLFFGIDITILYNFIKSKPFFISGFSLRISLMNLLSKLNWSLGGLDLFKTNVLSILIPEDKKEVKIRAFDFESYFGKDKTINLLSASMFEGIESNSFYLSGFTDSYSFIENFFDNLLTAENNGSYC